MKLSSSGAGIGAVAGFLARGGIAFWWSGGVFGLLALPSAIIGALVGAIAGATGHPVRGAIVGAVLSGLVFQAIMLFISQILSIFSSNSAQDWMGGSWYYAAWMAAAGGLAGAIGGGFGQWRESQKDEKVNSTTLD